MSTVYANHMGYSDSTPYEVIKDGENIKTVRAMKCEIKDSFKPDCVPGGFSCHVTNNYDQEWDIEPNPEGYQFKIRLNKKGEWRDPYGKRYSISDEPVMFRDYNF